MRLSQTENLGSNPHGLTPSAAFKFLIDRKPSRDLIIGNSLKPSGSWNFFANAMRNRVASFDPVEDSCEFSTVHRKFQTASDCPYTLGVSQIADIDSQGRDIEDVKIPY